jgi:hypothetical protein
MSIASPTYTQKQQREKKSYYWDVLNFLNIIASDEDHPLFSHVVFNCAKVSYIPSIAHQSAGQESI